MTKKILITGGIRSGKSRFALSVALSYSSPRVFLATAEPLDQEMRERILCHRAERKNEFVTIEEPLNLSEKVQSLRGAPKERRSNLQSEIASALSGTLPRNDVLLDTLNPSIIVIDCLTVWLGNLYHHFAENHSAIQNQVDHLIQVLKDSDKNIIMVTNEVGLGVISNDVLGRRFVDALGKLNQELAQICDEVVFMSCGIPQTIKGTFQHAKVDY